MKLSNGREVLFRRSVKATADLAEICPDKDISKLGELMKGGTGQQLATGAVLIRVLNAAYENHRALVEPGYVADPISVDEVMDLDADEFAELLVEAIAVFRADGQQDIATKPAPKKGKKTAE